MACCPSVYDQRPGTLRVPRAVSPLGNFASLGTSELVARALGFLATALLARRLSVEAFGMLGLATALMSYFGIALTAGFGDIGTREVARNPAQARRIASDATAVRLIIAMAGMAATVVIAFAFVPSAIQRVVLLLGTTSLVAIALDSTWVYRGLARSRTAGFAMVFSQAVYLAGVLALVGSPSDVVKVPLIQFAGDLLAAGILLTVLFRAGVPAPRLDGGVRLLAQSRAVIVARLLRTLIVTFDVLMLGVLATTLEVGLYTAAYRICTVVTMVAVSTHVVFLPLAARAGADSIARLSNVVTRSLSLTSAVILPIVVGGIVLAEPLLTLVFGPDYVAAADPMRLLLVSVAVVAVFGTAHNVFVALEQTGREAAMFGAAAAINVGLNLFLIPAYGLVGAAAAKIVTEALILSVTAISLYRSGLRPAVTRMLAPLLASVVMGVTLHAGAGRISLFMLIALGGLVYLMVLGLTGSGAQIIRDAGTHAGDHI